MTMCRQPECASTNILYIDISNYPDLGDFDSFSSGNYGADFGDCVSICAILHRTLTCYRTGPGSPMCYIPNTRVTSTMTSRRAQNIAGACALCLPELRDAHRQDGGA